MRARSARPRAGGEAGGHSRYRRSARRYAVRPRYHCRAGAAAHRVGIAARATAERCAAKALALVLRAVDEAVRAEPRHEAAQLCADLLDRMVLGLFAQLAEVRRAALVLGDPLVGEGAALDVGEDLLHRGARLRADDPLAARHVAVLGGVADRVAHVGDAALVDEVDDELHLVQALEVRHLGGVAGLDERFVAGADELGKPAAEDRLLAEEVGLGLLAEGRLDDRGARATDGRAVGETDLRRVAARVLMASEEARDAAAALVLAADEVAGALRRDHEDVHVGGRNDALEVDVEPVAERQVLALLQAGGDLGAVHVAGELVGDEDHDDVAPRRRFRRRQDAQPRAFCFFPRRAVALEADDDLDAAVAEVLRVRVPLAAVADHGDLLPLDERRIRVALGIDLHATFSFSSMPPPASVRGPRNIATRPVRTISTIPSGFKSSRMASIFSRLPVISTMYECGETSITLPRKMSTMFMSSPRVRPSAVTLMSTSSRSTCSVSLKSDTRMIETSLFSCFVICSTTASSPVVTSVMRDTVESSVSATERLSMLKPRPLKRPATRERTPNSFSTSTDIVCRIAPREECRRVHRQRARPDRPR